MQGAKVDRSVRDGDTASLGSLTLQFVEAPGHTYGSLAVFIPETGALFTGDTVMGSGSSVIARAGGLTRRGPILPNGPACIAKTGSVRMVTPPTWSRKVECPTQVTPISSCVVGGTNLVTPLPIHRGHGVGRRSRYQRQTSERCRAFAAGSRLWKVRPS